MAAREKNITFLIGNGFDVGMGMKSQYLDFYKVYIQVGGPYYPASGENDLIRALRKAEEEEKREPQAQDGIQRRRLKTHWSDYEKWFGELTKQCDSEIRKGKWGDDYRERLLTQNEEFQQIFYKYLKDQENDLLSKENVNKKIVTTFRKISAGNAVDAAEGANFQRKFRKLFDACDEAEKLGTEESGFSEKCQEWLTEFQQDFSENQRVRKNEQFFKKCAGQVMLAGIRSFYSERNIDDGETVIRYALNRDVDCDLTVKRNYRFVCFNYSSVIDKCVFELNALRERRYKALIKKIGNAYEKKVLPDFCTKSFKELLSMFMPEYHEKVLVCIKDYGQKNLDGTLTLEEAKAGCNENLRRWFDAEKFQTVHHAHGTLHDPGHSVLVMGVNDDGQIGENFGEKRNRSYSNRLIKKNIMGSQNKSNQLDTTLELIRSSDIIVVYGMSIGDTDRVYWSELYEWLQKDPGRHLIFYMYEKDYEPLRANKLNQIITTQAKLFREMTWRVDSEMKWCTYSGQEFCFKPGKCPKSDRCKRKRCIGQSMAQWCSANGLGANNQSCEKMTFCPNGSQCRDWNEIRKRIHFAVNNTIFGINKG